MNTHLPNETTRPPEAGHGAPGGRWTNGKSGYGSVSKLIHWITAVLMAGIVGLGLYSSTLPRDIQLRDDVLVIHKSFGLLVILLTLVRLAWILYSPAPMDGKKLKSWERTAAHIGHALLYLILLLMPLSGLMMSEGAGRDVTFFHLFSLPQLLPLDPALKPREQYFYQLGKFLHENVFEWSLYAIFALHIAGVVKHRLIDGDRDTLRRMWGVNNHDKPRD